VKILDTSFLVDYLQNKKYTLRYLERNNDEAFYANTITMFELFRGELKSGGDSESLQEDLEWLNEKELNRKGAKEAAKIERKLEQEGEKVNLADVLIAGTARETGAEIVTGDSDFQKIPEVEAINPEKER
jgi:tRNA(fMet)-specific endonuclease VapC